MTEQQEQQDSDSNDSKPEELKWLVMLPHSWGTSEKLEDAFLNSLTHWNEYGIEEEEIKIWMAKVDQESLEISMHGEVHSKVIENEDEVMVDPKNLKKFQEIKMDMDALLDRLLNPDAEFELEYPRSGMDRII